MDPDNSDLSVISVSVISANIMQKCFLLTHSHISLTKLTVSFCILWFNLVQTALFLSLRLIKSG